MADILHRVGIKTNSIEAVYRALTTREGLAGWWTTNTQEKATVLEISFNSGLAQADSICG